MTERYPTYDVLDKWSSVSFDNLTRGVLRQRLHQPPARAFLTEAEWTLMEALCAHLAPTPERGGPVPITPWIDADLQAGRGDGYRAPDMPPLQEAWRKGLAGLQAEARARFGEPFEKIGPDQREALCRRLFEGHADPSLWDGVPARAFFNDMLLKAIVSVYYAHPAAWSEMGFGGPASPRGYVRMGLGERDPWEAKEKER